MTYKRFFWLIIIIGFLTSSYVTYQRFTVERSISTYEVTMPYDEVLQMAAYKDVDLKSELSYWKSAGINSISLSELTLRSLYDKGLYHIDIDYRGNDVVVTGDPEGIDIIKRGFEKNLAVNRTLTQKDNRTLEIEGKVNDFFVGKIDSKNDLIEKGQNISTKTSSLLEYVGLGFDQSSVDDILASGLKLRLRPAYVYNYQDAEQSVNAFMQAVDRYSNQPYVIFSGSQVLGTDYAESALIDALKERNMAVGMIETSVQREHIKQTGLKNLVRNYDYKAVRVFSTWDYIRDRYDYKMPHHHNGEEVMNTFFRAITERNINVIYFKPFLKNGKMIELPSSVYKDNFKQLENRLAQHGIYNMTVDDGASFYRDLFKVSSLFSMMAAFAVVASGLLILNELFVMPQRLNLIFSILGFGIVSAIYLMGKGLSAVNLLFGLLCTISFASLSVLYIVKQAKKTFDGPKVSLLKSARLGIKVMFLAVLIAFLGAINEIAFFADSKFLLELGIFKGVKISQIVPLGLAMVFALIVFINEFLGDDSESLGKRLMDVLNMAIKLWQVILGVGLLAGLYLFLARSGHESGIEPSSFELLFRNSLEYVLYARPRTKAFVIGFPAIIFFIQLANQKKISWLYPVFAFAAGIGQTDILNTFSHIRTMVDVSIARVCYEVLFGIGFYVVYFVLIMLIVKIAKYVMHRVQSTKVSK